MLVEEHISFRLGRKTDLADEQQAPSVLSRLTPYSSKEQSYLRREIDETSPIDSDNDLLIHDTILPHRKRIRKDTFLALQQQYLPTDQSSPSTGLPAGQILEVSRSSFVLECFHGGKKCKLTLNNQVSMSVDGPSSSNF